MENDIVITNLPEEKIDEAVEVMLTAFENEALTSMWLDLTDPKLKKAYSKAIKIIYTVHLASGDPVYTAIENEKVVGIAALSTPGSKKSIGKAAALILRNLPQLLRIIPAALRAVRGLYRLQKPPGNLPKNHCTLEVFAVDPELQGRGIGSRLLNHIHHHHLGDASNSGIYLVTGDEKNVQIYEHFGYEVVEKRISGDITAYHMFKGNRKNNFGTQL